MSSTPIHFAGREVACRTFGRIITEWERQGLSLESLVAGSGCTVAHLRDKHARISWATYRAIMANTRKLWDDDGLVILGRISGLYGVRGWVKVYSDTEPRENLLNYSPWLLRQALAWKEWRLETGRRQGKYVVAKLAGCDDRDAAAGLIGMDIAVKRSQLPSTAAGEYYWTDLEGLDVVNLSGLRLGYVDYLFETGSNDVLVVKGDKEYLIPFILKQVVLSVDLDNQLLKVDWDPDF